MFPLSSLFYPILAVLSLKIHDFCPFNQQPWKRINISIHTIFAYILDEISGNFTRHMCCQWFLEPPIISPNEFITCVQFHNIYTCLGVVQKLHLKFIQLHFQTGTYTFDGVLLLRHCCEWHVINYSQMIPLVANYSISWEKVQRWWWCFFLMSTTHFIFKPYRKIISSEINFLNPLICANFYCH